jgi:hypothetical protein
VGAPKCCPEGALLLLVATRESIKELSKCYISLRSVLRQAGFLCVSTAQGQFGLHTAWHWLDLRAKEQRRKDQQKPEQERRGQLSAVSISV